jgi:hypothetical protein
LWARRQELPPLQTEPNDPLLLEARTQAKTSLPRFRELLKQYPNNAGIKLRFVSNSNQIEYLWAEVLEAREGEYRIHLETLPVTHSGRLDRLYTCKEEDIDDWLVTDDTGSIHGGFSQRAMFKIARRDGVKLSKRLLEMEKSYL